MHTTQEDGHPGGTPEGNEQHPESLATVRQVTTTPWKGRRLLPHVLDNGRVLLASYRTIAQAIREERVITPAGEWLVDNFHIVDEQVREIHDDRLLMLAQRLLLVLRLGGGPLAFHSPAQLDAHLGQGVPQRGSRLQRRGRIELQHPYHLGSD
jgi:hypothetical protein